jgi:plastocyanin
MSYTWALTLASILIRAEPEAPAPKAKVAAARGRVSLAGARPERPKKKVGVQTEVCGTERLDENLMVDARGGVANAVVALQQAPSGSRAGTPAEVRIDQRRCDFIPHVVVVEQGGKVAFGNSDPLLHNVRVLGAAESMNQVPPPQATIHKVFKTPGPHRIRCDFHGWMSAWVFVTQHPFAALTDAAGRFQIEGLPPGRHPVKVWHEKLGELEGVVETGKGAELRYPGEAAQRPDAPSVEPGEWD